MRTNRHPGQPGPQLIDIGLRERSPFSRWDNNPIEIGAHRSALLQMGAHIDKPEGLWVAVMAVQDQGHVANEIVAQTDALKTVKRLAACGTNPPHEPVND